jgi:glycosyltransferase involved in cell wall biosynthesis
MSNAAISLSNLGHEVYFITLEPRYEFIIGKGYPTLLKILSGEPNNVRIIKKRVGHEFEFGTPEYITYTYRKMIIDHLEPGIPIIPSDYNLIWSASCSLANRYPIIGILHCDITYYYDLAGQFAKQLSLVVGVSNRITKKFREQHPEIDPKIACTLYYGTSFPKTIPLENNNGNILNLIFIGRFEAPEKRAADLFNICVLLAAQNIAFHLDIVGNNPSNDEKYIEHFRKLGIERYITLRGWLSKTEIFDLLVASDTLLLTSDWEGTPIVMMEALSCGCSFVGTRVSGVEDFENHPLAQNCLKVFEIGDIKDAVDKIQTVCSIPEKVRRTAARKLAESYFNIDVCMEKYIDAIDAIPRRTITESAFSFSLKQLVYSEMISLLRKIKVIFGRNNKAF